MLKEDAHMQAFVENTKKKIRLFVRPSVRPKMTGATNNNNVALKHVVCRSSSVHVFRSFRHNYARLGNATSPRTNANLDRW